MATIQVYVARIWWKMASNASLFLCYFSFVITFGWWQLQFQTINTCICGPNHIKYTNASKQTNTSIKAKFCSKLICAAMTGFPGAVFNLASCILALKNSIIRFYVWRRNTGYQGIGDKNTWQCLLQLPHVSTFKALKMENQVEEENYLLTISIFQHL